MTCLNELGPIHLQLNGRLGLLWINIDSADAVIESTSSCLLAYIVDGVAVLLAHLRLLASFGSDLLERSSS